MRITSTLIAAALLLAAAGAIGEEIVTPRELDGFMHRGTTTASQTFMVSTPLVALTTDYDSDAGLLNLPRMEVPINVPQFDGSLGNLVAINIKVDSLAETEFSISAIGILDSSFDHEAGFYSEPSLFGGGAGYPVVGLLQRPTADPRGIAPGFHPLGDFGVYCFGIPADEEACEDYDLTGLIIDGTVNVFIFEDVNGPVYTLSDWIGGGFVPNFTMFVDNPGLGVTQEQFNWDFFNVAGATASVYTYLEAGTLTIEYVYEVDQPDADGVPDDMDNCSAVANADQNDTDGDNYGNLCDPDLDNNNIVNAVDLGMFKSVFFSTDANADFDGNGIVNAVDLGILKTLFFMPPGPSGLVP